MKQIVEQNEIAKLEKSKADTLLGWMSNHGYYDTGEVNLTIGIMIEFLGEHLKQIRIWEDEYRVTFKLNDKMLLSTYTELCDALWSAVKEVLGEL